MPSVMLVYHPEMAAYDLGPFHPLRPERVTLAVELMSALGMLAEERPRDASPGAMPAGPWPLTPDPPPAEAPPSPAPILSPEPAAEDDLLRVHDSAYVEAVRRASADPGGFVPAMGLGTADNPVSAGMHEASARICGGAIAGLRAVLDGEASRTFNVAGGLHHAHRARAAGFCVYNDPAVAMTAALAVEPSLRLAYVDIDAHHGDGVQEGFYDDPRVLTVSLHESGSYLFPGTGRQEETGVGDGAGYSLNVPMPPLADDPCYDLALREAIEPALRAYRPDAIVAQLGADAHHADPLTTLGLTIPGYRLLVRRIVALADELCAGRLAASGGGGYGAYSVVPRAWACALAEMLGIEPPEQLPEAWRRHASEAAGGVDPGSRLTEDAFEATQRQAESVLLQTKASIERLLEVSPLLG